MFSDDNTTYVFWDIDDCKIPEGLDAVAVSKNIRTSLAKMGHIGRVKITALGDLFKTNHEYFYASIPIGHTPAGRDKERRNMMLVEFLCKAIGTNYLSNYMLIIGDISKHMGFIKAFRYLKSKGWCYRVFLSQPQSVTRELLDNVTEVWLWENLAVGGKNVSKESEIINDEVDKVIEEDEDPYDVTTEIAVFWDMKDCQIPDGLTADMVSQNIRLALADIGLDGTLTIYGYGGDDMNLESSGIVPKHFPTGNKDERLDKILVDSLCWANAANLNDSRTERNVMLILGDISEHNEFTLAFNLLRSKNYNCILSQPERVPELIMDDGFTKWLWSSLSTGGKPMPPLRERRELVID